MNITVYVLLHDDGYGHIYVNDVTFSSKDVDEWERGKGNYYESYDKNLSLNIDNAIPN